MQILKNKGIRTKLLIGFSTLIVIPIITYSILSYSRTTGFIEKRSVEYAMEITEQVNSTIDLYVRSVDRLSTQTAYSDYTQALLLKDYKKIKNPEYEYGIDTEVAFRYLEGMRKTAYGVKNIYIYNSELNGYYGFVTGRVNKDYRLQEEDWYPKIVQSKGGKVLVGPYEDTQIDISTGKIISLVRKVQDLKKFEHLGFIIVQIDINEIFNEQFKNLGLASKSQIYIINEEGKLVFSNKQDVDAGQLFNSEVLEAIKTEESGSLVRKFRGEPSLITYNTSSFTNWKVVNITSRKNLLDGVEIIRDSSIVIGLALILLAFGASIIISGGIVKPIGRLKKMIKNIEAGSFGQTIQIEARDEIGSLTASFNRMNTRLKELIDQIYAKEREKRKAEIVALQAQINPHFLYNTLSTIKHLAEIQKAGGITDMVDSLIVLMQACTRYRDELITLEEEIKLIKSYINIQETRYFGKFTVEFDYAEDVLSYKSLKLILQPIVENSIFHGIKSKVGIGKIKVSIRIADNKLLYVVEDDGVGMSPEQLQKVLETEEDSQSGFEKVGVFNVNKRVKLCCGDEYGVEIESELDKGTKTTVKMPLIK